MLPSSISPAGHQGFTQSLKRKAENEIEPAKKKFCVDANMKNIFTIADICLGHIIPHVLGMNYDNYFFIHQTKDFQPLFKFTFKSISCVSKAAYNVMQEVLSIKSKNVNLDNQKLKLTINTALEAVNLIKQRKCDTVDLREFNNVDFPIVEDLFNENFEIKRLYINNVSSLPVNAGNLTVLHLKNCIGLKKIPDNMNSLTEISCIECPDLENLPENMVWLKSLDISYCTKVSELPDGMDSLTSLIIQGTKIQYLSDYLLKLKYLDCSGCVALSYVPDYINLEKLVCTSCFKLTYLPDGMIHLKELIASNCPELSSLPEDLVSVEYLEINRCPQLLNLPPKLPSLKKLSFEENNEIESLPDSLFFLEELSVKYCPRLKLGMQLKSLKFLDFSNNKQLKELPPGLCNLTKLNIENCIQVTRLPEDIFLLKSLNCNNCLDIDLLPQHIKSLTTIEYSNCPKLKLKICVENDCNLIYFNQIKESLRGENLLTDAVLSDVFFEKINAILAENTRLKNQQNPENS